MCGRAGSVPGAREGIAALADQMLAAPKVTVSDATLLEVANGVEKIFGARPPMAAGARQDVGDLVERQPPRIERRGSVHHEGQSRDRAG